MKPPKHNFERDLDAFIQSDMDFYRETDMSQNCQQEEDEDAA